MFVRALFLLLLALNIGGACWLLLAQRPTAASSPATGQDIPELVLLSERDGTFASGVELATAPESKADLANDQCRRLGPFSTQADTHAAMNALTPSTKRIRIRETRASQVRGYWVFLPAAANREQALATARRLSQKSVRDYYVVTAGDQQNTVSLGLFREQANAERRSAEIAALGFTPKINARSEDQPQYWLDYALSDDDPPGWRQLVPAPRDLREETIACE